jgi:phosphoribosylaminoimidazole-succinocarboxamide synthase
MLDETAITQLLNQAFESSHLPYPVKQSGKVRDAYPLADERRLLVTTDRLSAFDRNIAVVPYKGQVLNQLTAWWLEQTRQIVPNHLLSVPDPNAMLVRDAQPFSVEVIVRGYITGVTTTALWYRYALGEREIYGYAFPDGLRKNQELPQAIITPTTKGTGGKHDERLTCAEVVEQGWLDKAAWDEVQQAALALFAYGQQTARKAGLILVDTKYEFGRTADGKVALIDEVHTPDSSRFWKADSYAQKFGAGEEPENYDKEFIRLEYAAKGYRGDGELPLMPDALWTAASLRYISIYEMLTGLSFIPGQYPVEPRLKTNLEKAGLL